MLFGKSGNYVAFRAEGRKKIKVITNITGWLGVYSIITLKECRGFILLCYKQRYFTGQRAETVPHSERLRLNQFKLFSR